MGEFWPTRKTTRLVAPAPGAARLLPEARDRARVADEDAGVEAADVDAQLEGVRAGHAEDLALLASWRSISRRSSGR